jgi:DNA-binding Lrp family transcriptional regulator
MIYTSNEILPHEVPTNGRLHGIMATAYVLINCELGSEQAVIDQIKSIDGIKEVRGVFGAYDILIKIETPSVEQLREIITWKIRKIDKIRSTLTLMGIEGQG